MISVSPAVSARMRAVRRHGTTCEAALESALVDAELSFLRQVALLDCTVDFAFPDERLIVFVDGDFWHGRVLIERGQRSLSRSLKCDNREFWISKIVRNVERDRRQTARFRRHGWSVIRLWERDLLRDPSRAVRLLIARLKTRHTISKKRPLGAPLLRGRSHGQALRVRHFRSGGPTLIG